MLSENVKKYFENPRNILNVKTDDKFNLVLTFDNQETRIYNMEDKLNGVFSVLQNQEKFKKVILDEFGNVAWDIDENIDSSVNWNNRIDICKDALYMESSVTE